MPTSRHRHTIVLIEDHDDSRDAIAELLRFEGANVVSAATPDEALTAEYDQPVCVVLLDHGTGVGSMSSSDFVHARAGVTGLDAARIILLSGDARIAESAAKLGAVGYLQKPADVEALLAMVTKHCARS